jgi:hypothetical protein
MKSYFKNAVNIGNKFSTKHKRKKHTAIINNKLYGPFATEIELVRNIPVNLKNCDCIETVVKSQYNFTHIWELVK